MFKFFSSLFNNSAVEDDDDVDTSGLDTKVSVSSEEGTSRLQLASNFYDRYINNDELLSSLTPETKSLLNKFIAKSYKELSASTSINKSPERQFSFFSYKIIMEIELVIWLHEMGYGKTLYNTYQQKIYTDTYGDEVYDDAERELQYFYDEKLFFSGNNLPTPFCSYFHGNYKHKKFEEIGYSLLQSAVDYFSHSHSHSHTEYFSFETTDPYEYEHLVAEKFNSMGWSARATSGSGDQGADVIAKIGNFSIVVQCKLYSQPVGNKAVQEVSAAKGHYKTDHAIVITNNTYTKSARQLASSLDVELAHHDDLTDIINLLNSKLGLETPPQQVGEYVDYESGEFINSRNAVEDVAIQLESSGWKTSYDPDEDIDSNGNYKNTLVVNNDYDESQDLVIICTALKIPIPLSFILYHLELANGIDRHLVVTSDSGFAVDAMEYLVQHIEDVKNSSIPLNLMLLSNDEISEIDEMF